MISRAIGIAQQSGLFSHIVVSTDDPEIAAISRQVGALTPFVRPPELSDDLTPTVPVIAHAVQSCIGLGWAVQQVCCIYPCVPLLHTGDMAQALDLLVSKEVDFVYPVTAFAHPVQRAMRRLGTGQMQFLQPEYEMTRTQDLEKTFHDAGQFYWGQSSAWLAHKKMHTDGLGLPIPNWRVVDIDTEDDWKRAELIFHAIAAETA